jgi:hypothetical protein
MRKEEWRDAVGWPGYRICNTGRLVRLSYVDTLGRTWREREVVVSRNITMKSVNGFVDVNFPNLMLRTFVGPPPDPKERAKISQSVEKLWQDGVYANRNNTPR